MKYNSYGNYDPFPSVRVAGWDGCCVSGWEAIRAEIRRRAGQGRHTVCCELYPGVCGDTVLRELLPLAPEKVIDTGSLLLSPAELIPVEKAEGRILADAGVQCPPAVPIRIAGERIDAAAIACFQYYGIRTCRVLRSRQEERHAP